MSEWNLRDELIHLNHAAVGPWPQRTKIAINQFVEENVTQGSLNYLQWVRIERELKQNLQQLINAKRLTEIALLKNTSEALSVVAYGLAWKSGDNIVISNQEFPSNTIVWESLKPKGVEVRYADLYSAETPEQALCELCDENTKLLSISSVQYATGLKMDCEQLGKFCRNNDILFCIDAIQSIGAEAFDVQKNLADFVVADGHKWMLGPEGVALFYCREDVMDQLSLTQYGWHMVENYLDYDDKHWELAKSARRFECGSPNMLGIHGLNASASLLLEVGMPQVVEQLQDNVSFLINEISQLPQYRIKSDQNLERRSGIVSFELENRPTEELFEHLKTNNIFCAMRAKRIRFSPHYYTEKLKLHRTIQILREFDKN